MIITLSQESISNEEYYKECIDEDKPRLLIFHNPVDVLSIYKLQKENDLNQGERSWPKF